MNKIPFRALLCGFFWLAGLSITRADYETLIDERRAAISAVLDSMEQERAQAKVVTEVVALADSSTAAEPEPPVAEPPVPQEVQPLAPPAPPAPAERKVRVSGQIRTSMGIDSDGQAIFTRANADLNEKNYRELSDSALNARQNTYDPAIYSRVKVVLDAAVSSAVSMHINITADPWSYVGKSREELVTGTFGDTAKVQWLAWGPNRFAINRSILTKRLGDGFNLPEPKIVKGTVPATGVTSAFGDNFTIPAMEVNYTFQPLREAWFDIKPTDKVHFRVFPMAYDNQAMTTDDPLHLSNNKTWWEESPWLRDWKPGNYNSVPADFTKGGWDRSLAFYTRDSDNLHLTALRGVSMDFAPTEETSIKAEVASPKTLWQDYGVVTAVPASVRAKQFLGDRLYVGTVANAHQGFVNGERDAENYTGGFDTGIVPVEGLELDAQYSHSRSRYDETTPAFTSKKQGDAYYISLEATSNPSDVLNKDYFALAPAAATDDFYKTRLFWGRMDQNFESSLSNYQETQRDAFWSRHLTFYPSTYRYMPGVSPGLSEDDLIPFAVGDGLTYNRSVYGWRADGAMLEGRVKGMGDVRYILTPDGKHVDTAARTQWTFKATDKLTTKALFVADVLPKTEAGVDPFITDPDTGKPLANAAIVAGEDPSLNTGALGANYALTDWAAINGVWEYTNDQTLATGNFPRGLLNSASFATYTENGKTYRETFPFLYSQGYFDQPPYDYFNIFKTGLALSPNEMWHLYLDYTRNPNKFAGNIDDNMNHYGIEASFVPSKQLGFFARYSFSRWNDINRLVFDNAVDYKGFNNVFLETRYLPSESSSLSVQYGVGPAYGVQTSFTDPLLGYYSSSVLETQHIIRLIYEKKF